MPFKSKAQERFAFANANKFGGKHALEEWVESTPAHIPEKLHPSKTVKVPKRKKK